MRRPFLVPVLTSIVALGACEGPPDSDDEPTDASTDVPTDSPTDTDAPAPDPLSADEIAAFEAGVESALSALVAVRADSVFDALDHLDPYLQPECTDILDLPGFRRWDVDCDLPGGVRAFGSIERSEGDETLPAGFRANLETLAQLVAPGWSIDDEVPLTGARRRTTSFVLVEDRRDVIVRVDGVFGDDFVQHDGISWLNAEFDGGVGDDQAPAGSWVEQGLGAEEAQLDLLTDGDLVTVRIIGAWGGLSSDVVAIKTSELFLGHPSCTAEPVGTLAIRAASGAWYDLVFDGSDGGDACDGCADVRDRGSSVGRACVTPPDLSPIAAELTE